MVFNSIEFAIFFPLVFLLYWLFFNKQTKLRNLFLILASYFFYGVWDWRFLILIFISSLGDYLFGTQIFNSESVNKRKLYLAFSVCLNLGILGFFKYFNFFIDNFVNIFTLFGKEFSYESMNIILPVGISFYTFQTMSYTFDIYYNRLKPTKNPIAFFAFVSFFPQLVAGPIERAKKLLPQFHNVISPNYTKIRSGLLTIAMGLFLKIVIADRLAIFVDGVFGNIKDANGLPILVGIIFFSFQLYLDFSAYSQIAIGTASTLGFDLSENFRRPYLSKSFSDFWTRWHISLSSWFRDYLYIPLGGNRKTQFHTMRNVVIVFILSGLWHGASWNFIIWGGLNGLFLIILDRFLTKTNKYPFFKTLFVITCWTISLFFFRAKTLAESVQGLFSLGFFNQANLYNFGLNAFEFKFVTCLLIGLVIMEILTEKKFDLLTWITSKPRIIRYIFYLFFAVSILLFGAYGVGHDSKFIYFQF